MQLKDNRPGLYLTRSMAQTNSPLQIIALRPGICAGLCWWCGDCAEVCHGCLMGSWCWYILWQRGYPYNKKYFTRDTDLQSGFLGSSDGHGVLRKSVQASQWLYDQAILVSIKCLSNWPQITLRKGSLFVMKIKALNPTGPMSKFLIKCSLALSLCTFLVSLSLNFFLYKFGI